MADEQFPWLDWPHHYAPQNLSQHAPHAEENSNSQWRGPFYNSNANLPETQLNNATTQAPYYPSYQQQEESYVRLEDVLQYPSYRWGPPPAREYQKPASHLESTSGLPLPTASPPQSSAKRPSSSRLPNPMPHAGAGEPQGAVHAAKRRRVGSPASSKPPLQSVPQAASVSQQAQALPAGQNYRPGSQYQFPSSASQTPNPPMPQTTKPPTTQRARQEPPRTGPQHMAPSQTRPASRSQVPSRTSSPATSQGPTPLRMPQHGQQPQSKAHPRGSSSVGPQAAAQQTSRHNAQYPSSPTTLQALPRTVAPLDTQIRPLNPSPQNRPQTLSQNARQSAPQSPRPAQQIRGPSSKTTSQPSSTRPTTQSPLPLPVPRPAAQSATPPVPHNVSQTLPPQGPPSTQAAPNPALPKPPQPQPRMAQAPHTQPAHGPQGKFVAYTFQPENPADRTHLKRRMDIVSRLKESEAAQKVTYDPKTIARDILITSNRHPTEATLNYHLFRLRDVFSAVDINSDLETFRWDLVDPSELSRDLKAKAGVPPSRPDQGSVQTKQTAPPQVQVSVPVGSNTTQNQHGVPQPTFQQPHPPPQYQPKPQPQPQQKPQPQPQPQPQVQLPAPNPPVQQPNFEPSTPSTPQSMEKKRRGRPPGSTNKPKAATAAAVPQAPTSSYPVYACRWGNCQSELHNLELLKKHLFKNHVSYQITCGWKGCAFTATLPAAELMKHVKKEHLEFLAWNLGDGPAVPSSVDQGSSSNTVPLTIPESNQPGNEDSLIFPADYRSIRAFNRVHGNHSQHEKAGEIFKAVQRLKEHIGVGLDPGGCELATPLRNPRVADDEDVYEVRTQS